VVALTAAAVALLVLVGPPDREAEAIKPLAKRAQTLLQPGKTANESSLTTREVETRQAWDAVRPHLLTGIGPGVPWGTYLIEPAMPSRPYTRVNTIYYLHNQYLYLVVVAGIPGLLAFLAALVLGLRTAWSERADRTVRALGTGLIMLGFSSVVMISLSTRNWTVAIGVVLGAITVLAAARKQAPTGGP
jgi:O-antigen ligase